MGHLFARSEIILLQLSTVWAAPITGRLMAEIGAGVLFLDELLRPSLVQYLIQPWEGDQDGI